MVDQLNGTARRIETLAHHLGDHGTFTPEDILVGVWREGQRIDVDNPRTLRLQLLQGLRTQFRLPLHDVLG